MLLSKGSGDVQNRYEDLQNEVGSVYILIIDSGSRMAKTIKSVTKHPYNHSSIAFDKSLKEMYSFNTGGFIVEDLKSTYQSSAKFSLYRVDLPKATIIKMKQEVNSTIENADSYKYNWKGLITAAFDKESRQDGQFFCSEYVAYLFEKCGVPILDKPLGLVKPYDFAKSKYAKFIYRGTVKHYRPERINK